MEIDGQSGEIVPTPEDESEEFTTIHIGYTARHIPETQADIF